MCTFNDIDVLSIQQKYLDSNIMFLLVAKEIYFQDEGTQESVRQLIINIKYMVTNETNKRKVPGA